MDTYYTGNLPQSTTIVTELNPEHTYILPPSQTLCFPFKMKRDYQQIIVDLADTTPFVSTFIPGSRAWPSEIPASQSITASPYASQASVKLPPSGVKWNFWLLELEQPNLDLANINRWVLFDTTYWMNVQNLQNRQSYFYCRFTYYGQGITFEE